MLCGNVRRNLILLAVAATWSTFGQSVPSLSVNLNANGKIHLSWVVPTVSAVLQETSAWDGGAWQSSAVNIITNGCTCNAIVSPSNSPHFYRLASTNPPAIGLYLGAPIQLLTPHEWGMTDVPDMHTAILQQSNTYRLWIAGRFENDTVEGATGLLLTSNFVDFASGYSPGSTNVVPVFVPSCRGSNAMAGCYTNFDADYAGADLVWTATNGTDLLMLYHGETWAFGTNTPNLQQPSWATVGLARSADNGITWSDRQAIISSSEAKPVTNPAAAQIYGTVEPGAILASNYVYAFYSFFSVSPETNPALPVIQVARSDLTNDGVAGSWFKYYSNSFSSPGLGGAASPIVPTVCTCTRPAQPWPVFSSYLNAYVLVFICEEGWFFSISTDLLNWSQPVQFFTAPNSEFIAGLPTDENVILVTPGNPVQVIGQTGLVLYAHTAAWKNNSHELWSRPFIFEKSP